MRKNLVLISLIVFISVLNVSYGHESTSLKLIDNYGLTIPINEDISSFENSSPGLGENLNENKDQDTNFNKEIKKTRDLKAISLVKVLIYNGPDTLPKSVEGVKSSLNIANNKNLVPGLRFAYSTNSVINSNTLKSFDVLVIPGGNSGGLYINNRNLNRESIKNFVKSGKGYLGICAGAYAASNRNDGRYYGWGIAPHINCKPVEYTGYLTISITNNGQKILKISGIQKIYHFRGPAMYGTGNIIPMAIYADRKTGYKNLLAIVEDTYGNGKTILCGSHLEYDPQKAQILARMIAWEAKKLNVKL
jgi:glutamine amidotransferase-like uncharacterized protein